MEIINYGNKLPAFFTQNNLFEKEPFTLIDVGCSGGLENVWERFGSGLIAHGFDPNIEEVTALQRKEKRPQVQYHDMMIGLDDTHPFMQRKIENDQKSSSYYQYFDRSTAMWVYYNVQTSRYASADSARTLSFQKTSIDEFVQTSGLVNIDFIKIDTDGNDLEAAVSGELTYSRNNVLGILIEVPLCGGCNNTDNTFHSIDLFFRRMGYLPFSTCFHRYSRPELPSTFVYDMPAQTLTGQSMWGDVLYLRDPASPHYTDIWPELTPMQSLKMLCLFDIFDLRDCAVELMLKKRAMFEEMFSVSQTLDLLTPDLHGERLKYDAYVARFREDHREFYPSKKK